MKEIITLFTDMLKEKKYLSVSLIFIVILAIISPSYIYIFLFKPHKFIQFEELEILLFCIMVNATLFMIVIAFIFFVYERASSIHVRATLKEFTKIERKHKKYKNCSIRLNRIAKKMELKNEKLEALAASCKRNIQGTVSCKKVLYITSVKISYIKMWYWNKYADFKYEDITTFDKKLRKLEQDIDLAKEMQKKYTENKSIEFAFSKTAMFLNGLTIFLFTFYILGHNVEIGNLFLYTCIYLAVYFADVYLSTVKEVKKFQENQLPRKSEEVDSEESV